MKNYTIIWKGGNFYFVPHFIQYYLLTEQDGSEDDGFYTRGFRLKFN